MDLSLLSTSTVVTFLLVLFRVTGLFLSAPLLNMRSMPQLTKIGISFALAFILFPFHSQNFVVPQDLIQFAVLAGQEIIIGLLLGFTANLIFVAIQMAGEYISVQMGMSMSSILDPMTGTQVPTLGQVYFYFALLIFLSMNAHHALILGINHSFDVVPLGKFMASSGVMAERFIQLGVEMFTLALIVCVPVMGTLLVTEIALGYMAKVMPQMNIFMVGMPLKLAVGLTALAVSFPYVNQLLIEQFDQLSQYLKVLLQ